MAQYKDREVIIGKESVEHYFHIIATELQQHHEIIIKVRKTIDQPETIVDNSFHNLLKKIISGNTNTCDGTIELIKEFQDHAIIKRRDGSNAPVFFNRIEKAKYLIEKITNFGVEVVEWGIDVTLESRKGDKFIGNWYRLEVWGNLTEPRERKW